MFLQHHLTNKRLLWIRGRLGLKYQYMHSAVYCTFDPLRIEPFYKRKLKSRLIQSPFPN